LNVSICSNYIYVRFVLSINRNRDLCTHHNRPTIVLSASCSPLMVCYLEKHNTTAALNIYLETELHHAANECVSLTERWWISFSERYSQWPQNLSSGYSFHLNPLQNMSIIRLVVAPVALASARNQGNLAHISGDRSKSPSMSRFFDNVKVQGLGKFDERLLDVAVDSQPSSASRPSMRS
jgi:hypothetical protein